MGRIPRCRSRSPGEKATLFQASNGEPGMDLAQSKTPSMRRRLLSEPGRSHPCPVGIPGRFMKVQRLNDEHERG